MNLYIQYLSGKTAAAAVECGLLLRVGQCQCIANHGGGRVGAATTTTCCWVPPAAASTPTQCCQR